MLLEQVVDLTFGEGLIYSLICILIVFLVLGIICMVVWLMKFTNKGKTVEASAPQSQYVPASQPVQVQPTKKLTIEDITDEDMMAAALVATIDYRNEVKTDVRLVSIKQIN